MLDESLRYKLRSSRLNARSRQGLLPKYGDEIFTGGDYPREWSEIIGQERAKERLQAAILSARMRAARLDHTLLASGLHGVGKTTLAKLTAYQMKAGYIEVSGVVSVDEMRTILHGMQDHDIVFWDEVHLAIAGGASKAGWVLPWLTDGGLMTARGFEPMPDVTLIAATTDAQRLTQAFLSRFMVQPVLEQYSPGNARLIARSLAERMGLGDLPDDLAGAVASASNGNPRDMRALLIALRDTNLSRGAYDLDVALTWIGVSEDGLSVLAQEYMLALGVMCEGKAGEKTIASQLGEPGPLRHTEQLLAQKGYLTIEPDGRTMTELGMTRVERILRDRGLLED